MCAVRYTHESVKALARAHGFTYLGSPKPKSIVTENWQCPNGHEIWKTPTHFRLHPGCAICYLGHLDKTGELETRLAALNTELVGKWNGAKSKNSFRCLECKSEWQEFGLCVTNKGNRCPTCFPRKTKGIKAYLVPLPQTAPAPPT